MGKNPSPTGIAGTRTFPVCLPREEDNKERKKKINRVGGKGDLSYPFMFCAAALWGLLKLEIIYVFKKCCGKI